MICFKGLVIQLITKLQTYLYRLIKTKTRNVVKFDKYVQHVDTYFRNKYHEIEEHKVQNAVMIITLTHEKLLACKFDKVNTSCFQTFKQDC